MKKIYLLIGFLIALFIIIFSMKNYTNKYNIKCPEISKAYIEWFPYNENDILTFKNNDSIRLYEIKNISLNRTKSYQSNMKCGCCEEGIYISLIGKKDTIIIDFFNFKNLNSCMGSTKSINRNSVSLNVKTTQNSNDLKLNQISFDSLTLKKGIGIKEIIWKGKLWEFENIKKVKTENKIMSNAGC